MKQKMESLDGSGCRCLASKGQVEAGLKNHQSYSLIALNYTYQVPPYPTCIPIVRPPATWSPQVCRIMAFGAHFRDLELLFIPTFKGFRHTSQP